MPKYKTTIVSVLVEDDNRTLEQMVEDGKREAASMDHEVGTTTTVTIEVVEEE